MREDIFVTLKSDIIEGRLKSGTQLKETQLAERFKVSRTPVRDALSRLEEAGLAVRRNRCLEVRGMDPEQAIQVYDVRILLEEEVAGSAALNRSLSDVLELEALLARDRGLKKPDERTLIENNLEFHAVVWRASGNPILVDLLERLMTHLVHAPSTTLVVGDRQDEALDEHEELVKAISERDADAARAIARKHFTRARQLRLDLLREAALKDAISR